MTHYRMFQQSGQMRTDEQAETTIAKGAVDVYPALAATPVLQDYSGANKSGFQQEYPIPGDAFNDVAQVRTTEQDGTVDSAPQKSYPLLATSYTGGPAPVDSDD